MSDAAPLWASKYVGLPYKAGGRHAGGIDCWGLVRLVLATEIGVELPVHGVTRDVEAAMQRAMRSADWIKVDRGQEFDVMMMVTPTGPGRSAPLHVGVMVSPRLVLHVDEGLRSCIVGVGHPTIQGRFHGYYRHISRA